ncbi:MAG TPA: hypothetical protein PLI98_05230 [Candidatus Hydrogenedentes bacterium]|nr:hypothetical protein [Candidatus Hydrogenedentota bacterium]
MWRPYWWAVGVSRRIRAISSAAAAPKWMAQKSRAMSSMESSGFHMSR